MSAVVEIEGGFGRGNRAHVASDGAVRAFPGGTRIVQTSTTVPTTSAEILDDLEGRRAVQLRNQSETNAIAIRLGASATTSDFRVQPGEIYTFPAGVSWEGSIHAIAIGGPVPVAAIEFYEEP